MRMVKTPKWLLLFVLFIFAFPWVVGCAKEGKTPSTEISMSVIPVAAAVLPEKKAVSMTILTKGIKVLDEALKAGVPVVVKLGSDRCAPCRAMKPILKELAVEQDGKAIFLDLDVYENRDLASQAQVRVIPTILFYDRAGNPRAKAEGAMSKDDLLRAIKELELNK